MSETLKPKYHIGDIVILRNGQAMCRSLFPKGKVRVEIKEIIPLEQVIRYRVVLIENSETQIYICHEDEIIEYPKIFNPTKRDSL